MRVKVLMNIISYERYSDGFFFRRYVAERETDSSNLKYQDFKFMSTCLRKLAENQRQKKSILSFKG